MWIWSVVVVVLLIAAVAVAVAVAGVVYYLVLTTVHGVHVVEPY
jgi:hypothetical protein